MPGNVRTKPPKRANQSVCCREIYGPNPQKGQISPYAAGKYTDQITKNSNWVRTGGQNRLCLQNRLPGFSLQVISQLSHPVKSNSANLPVSKNCKFQLHLHIGLNKMKAAKGNAFASEGRIR